MSTDEENHRVQVAAGIGVAHYGGKVHLEVSKHLDEAMSIYFTQGLLLTPYVAGQLGQALLDMAAVAVQSEAVAS